MAITKGCGKACPANPLLLCQECAGTAHRALWPAAWAVPGVPARPAFHNAFIWSDLSPGIYEAWEAVNLPAGGAAPPAGSYTWVIHSVPDHPLPADDNRLPSQGGPPLVHPAGWAPGCGQICPINMNLRCGRHHDGSYRHYVPWEERLWGPHPTGAQPGNAHLWDPGAGRYGSFELGKDPNSGWNGWDWVKHKSADHLAPNAMNRPGPPVTPPAARPALPDIDLVVPRPPPEPVEEDDLFEASPADLRRVALERDERGDLVPRRESRFMKR